MYDCCRGIAWAQFLQPCACLAVGPYKQSKLINRPRLNPWPRNHSARSVHGPKTMKISAAASLKAKKFGQITCYGFLMPLAPNAAIYREVAACTEACTVRALSVHCARHSTEHLSMAHPKRGGPLGDLKASSFSSPLPQSHQRVHECGHCFAQMNLRLAL